MLKIYNTLTKKKEPFSALAKKTVKMYTCGPTVYDYAHIGNLAAYTYADLLRRYLEYKGYQVKQIVNITDVGHLTDDDVNQADSGEDKMLKAALRERKTPQEIAKYYTQAFFSDIKKLNIQKALQYPRATQHIPQMIKIIQILLKKGLAYEKNGNVFFDVEKFKDYGKLSGKKLSQLKMGARLEKHPDKKNPFDFALWLKAPQKHLLKWKSPWSLGYPGWHIECSAMAMEHLGKTLDIHSGGEDHIFPHHENEIAQSEGATGQPFARFWFHNRFLLVDGQKMSKSKANFYTLKDITKKGYSPMAFRLLVLGSHYRSNLNFVWPTIRQAQKNLDKISNFVEELKTISQQKKAPSLKRAPQKEINFKKFLSQFEKALDNDLNSPLALSILFKAISQANQKIQQKKLLPKEAKAGLEFWKKINKVLGLKLEKKKINLPPEIIRLAEERQALRKTKNFKEADEKRSQIEAQGFIIEDLPNGYKIHPKEN